MTINTAFEYPSYRRLITVDTRDQVSILYRGDYTYARPDAIRMCIHSILLNETPIPVSKTLAEPLRRHSL
jgi:hypothetical protein